MLHPSSNLQNTSHSCQMLHFSFWIENVPETGKKDQLSELELMKKLRPHPHVIQLIGCVSESGKKLKYMFIIRFFRSRFRFAQQVTRTRVIPSSHAASVTKSMRNNAVLVRRTGTCYH